MIAPLPSHPSAINSSFRQLSVLPCSLASRFFHPHRLSSSMKKPPDLPSPHRLPLFPVTASLPDLHSSSRNLLAFSVGESHPSPIEISYHHRYGLVLSRLGYCSSPWLRSGAFLGTARLSSLLTVPFAAPPRQRYGFDLSCRWSYPSVWLPSASPGRPSAAIPRRSPFLYEGMTAPFPSDLRSCPLPSPRYVHWYCISFVY